MATTLELLLSRASLNNVPLVATLELTYVCNMHCTFCYNPVQRKGQVRSKPAPEFTDAPLAYDEIIRVLDELQRMGTLYLTLSGGEAMLHPRFWDIAEEAKKRSFATRIFTNGIAINEQVADRLAELRPFCLEISIHGASDATAEALNQVPGSHTRLLRVLDLLKARDLRVFLKCVVTRLVENELLEIRAIGERYGYHVYFDPVLTVSDDGEPYPLELRASDDAIRFLHSENGLKRGSSPFERKDGQPNCGVGSSTLSIDPYGNVSPCVQWKETVGNVRKQKLADIWATSRELERIRHLNRTIPMLLKGQTDDSEFCAHCPGLSQVRYGDPARPEEQYLRMARIKREIHEARELVTTTPTPDKRD